MAEPSRFAPVRPDPRSYTPKHLAERILAEQAALEARGAPDGERKTITALFADIKGSMELLEDLDPEDARRLIDPALQIMMDAVHRYEGYVAQSTGDGIFALFGAPIANEDHPRRACYAALWMQEKIRHYAEKLRLEEGFSLQVRVGLNTGEVVLRSIRTGDLHTEYVPIGHSIGLAARMQGLAAPGSVVVSEGIHKVTEGYFEFRSLGPTRVKGVGEPIPIYEVTGVGPLRTPMEVAVRRGLLRFVGRRDEMEQLRRAWESAKGGHGQIVAVMGEAGVGKSRLFYEFKVPVQSQCLVLEAFSVSHGKAYAYLPLIDLLKSYFRIGLEDDERTRKEKVAGKVIILDRKLEDALPYLFSLLGVTDPTSSLQQMDPQIRRQRTMEAVKRVLVRETLNQPIVVIFEDLNWIDGETQAFLEVLSQAVATARLLLLVNYRPEYRHGWGSKTYYRQLRLDPLGKEEAEELLTALLGDGGQAGIESLKRLILEKTEGNPFFMEEVVQTLAEEAVLTGDRGNYRLEKAATELHIPTTVQGVLAARIDRLPANEKEFLQILSVIGKEFSLGLLRKVTGHSEGELYHLLSHVQAGEFVYEQPAFPEPEYIFKHALTQEVAYQSVLKTRRQEAHARVARVLERDFPERVEEIARHCAEGDLAAEAIAYYQLAGERAAQRSAHVEAVAHLARGIELLAKLPEGQERARQELALRVALGFPLVAIRGYGNPEVEQTYDRARALCQEVGDAPGLFEAVWGLSNYYQSRSKLGVAQNLAEQLVAIAERAGEARLMAWAHLQLGSVLFWRGEPSPALTHLEAAITLHNPAEPWFLTGAPDPGVAARVYAAIVLWQLGYHDRALHASREGVALGRACSHAFSLALALIFAAMLHYLRREPEAVREHAVEAITLATEQEFPLWRGMGHMFLGWVLAYATAGDRGIDEIEQGLAEVATTGAEVGASGGLHVLADAQRAAGHEREALNTVDAGLTIAEQRQQHTWDAELHRLRGDILLKMGDDFAPEAAECFARALETARGQGSPTLELRAATGLGCLLRRQGRAGEARVLVEAVYRRFTEGFDTPDLRDARALLEEL